MVQNVIDISERENRVINIVKAKYGLKTKSEAISMITKVYEDNFLELCLSPEYTEKLRKIRMGKYNKFENISDLRKQIEG